MNEKPDFELLTPEQAAELVCKALQGESDKPEGFTYLLTSPHVSLFMQRFHHLGLIQTSEKHHLIIKEHKLMAYLDSIV
jgi:hypothetical protein